MSDFLRSLPAPQHSAPAIIASHDPTMGSFALVSTAPGDSSSSLTKRDGLQQRRGKPLPPYGKRKGWLPRSQADFGGGGAYPEIHIAQYPLGLGLKKDVGGHSSTLALQTDSDGRIAWDAVAKHRSHQAVVYSRPGDQKAKWSDADDLQKPSEEAMQETIEKTKAALELALAKKAGDKSTNVSSTTNSLAHPQFVRYTPKVDAPGYNPACAQRLVSIVEKPKDPLEPSKFKNKSVPRAPTSPPPPVQHSPPRKLTQEDQKAWKIPPCVSNWKNQKGYTIPLDKRVGADGRHLQTTAINDKFAALAEDLYIAERKAREEIALRNDLRKKQRAMEEDEREQQLRSIAAEARQERAQIAEDEAEEERAALGSDSLREEGKALQRKRLRPRSHSRSSESSASSASASRSRSRERHAKAEEVEARRKRQAIERERRREVERDFRLEQAGKKIQGRNRDEERDISERIALGQAQPTSQEMLYDSRLFNQNVGMDSGFSGGDDKYSVYDKPLFADRSAANVYRYQADRVEKNVGDTYTKQKTMQAFRGSADGTEAEAASSRDGGPVQFEKDASDPFGLNELLEGGMKKK